MNESENGAEATQNLTLFNTFNASAIDCSNLWAPGTVLSSNWFQAFLYFMYSCVFFIALVGNILVCYVVNRSPRMKTVTNYFIVNLAIGDILMDLFCVPTSFVSTLILQHWPFGPELCPSVNYSQAVSVLVSAYTLVAISIDRYMAIMWPLRPRMSKKQAKLSILAVWLLALIISLPIPIVSRIEQPNKLYEYCNLYICQESWKESHHRYYYSIALMILQYTVPLLVLTFTYTSIAIMVWGKRPPGEAENARDQRMARSKRKMVKMMMTVVFVFTICWLPFNVLTLIMDNNVNNLTWQGLPYVWAGLHWLSMSHACYNPVIYCWMNARFRSGFLAVLSRFPMIRHIIPDQNHTVNTSIAGIALTGFDGQNHSGLRRINTCTTYVSVRRKTNNSYEAPARSASFRYNNSQRTPLHRHFLHLQTQPEESI